VINIQPIDKKTVSDGTFLDLHSIFYTIQGEGPFAGHPAVFVRLAGCNLRCPSCDTDYTEGRRIVHHKDIVDGVLSLFPTRGRLHKLVVITGGEPFRQNLTKLAYALNDAGCHIQVETNGSLAAQGEFPFHDNATIVCSPKSGKIAIQHVDVYKYVIDRNSVDPVDGLPIEVLGHSASPHVARPPADFDGPIYVQPMDTKTDATKLNIEAARRISMDHGYILQLQIHKIIGVE
jgi:organic radical activating enzyme